MSNAVQDVVQEFKLRYYQEDAIKYTFDYINKGGRAGIAALPTAAGKSIVIAKIIEKVLKAKSHVRMMMLTHVKELIEQNFSKIKSVWPTCPAGIYSAGIGLRQFSHPVIYGGIQSCYRKPHLFGHIDLLFIDECHLISEKAESMYGAMIKALREVNPNMVVIGLTATPYRLGMGLLTEGPIFEDIYYDITQMDDFVRLIDEGYLSDLQSIDTDAKYDLTGVKMSGGGFQKDSLDENVNRDEITREIVLETIARTKYRNKGLAFCVSKSHAENMSLRFSEAGYSSAYIHSDLTKTEREDILERYANGEFKILTNVGVLTTGFDAPDVDFLVVARPTESTSLHVQILGRGMRVHPSKENTLVLDFAGNTQRLGPINDPLLPVMKGEARGEAPIRICPDCNTINHASVRQCKHCGHEFPPPRVRFTGKVQAAEIIKRRDIPKIEMLTVDSLTIGKHTSVAGNETVKMTFYCGKHIFDTYLLVDRSNRTGYSHAMSIIGKLKFTEKLPPDLDSFQMADFMKDYLVKPTELRVWLNKPQKGRKKRRKEILDVRYSE